MPEGHGYRRKACADRRNQRPVPAIQSAIREEVERFNAFTADNDPNGERDFGAFTIEGKKVFWKIDYYAPDMAHGSEDPADPKQTVRVLTIMLAEEY